jgi:ubiquinone/menaquinone biosynthesis C-methylase UbiE
MTNSQGSVVFDRVADFYDATRGYPPGEERVAAAMLAEAGNLTHASQIIEIGIGTGRIALPLAPHVGAIFGVDLSRLMMARLRAKQTNELIYVAQADATRLPFGARRFDAAVAVHVFHLIPQWRAVLAELKRVLRPEGVLVHLTDSKHGFDVLADAWESAVPRQEPVGMPFPAHHESILAEGWELVGDVHRHAFTYERTPQQYYDELTLRSMSSSWHLSDEQLERGLAAVREAMAAHFPDPRQPVQLGRTSETRVYRPAYGMGEVQ